MFVLIFKRLFLIVKYFIIDCINNSGIKRHWSYLKYIIRHKYYVFVEGRKVHTPLYLLIVHDLSKFLPQEWLPYARTFYKKDGSGQYKETVEFANAWLLHQHRNKHHWQYWLNITFISDNFGAPLKDTSYMVWDSGKLQRIVKRNSGSTDWLELYPPFPGDIVSVDPMPEKYRLEMLADWKGAGKTLGKPDTKAWYLANKDKMQLHDETRVWIEEQLGIKNA